MELGGYIQDTFQNTYGTYGTLLEYIWALLGYIWDTSLRIPTPRGRCTNMRAPFQDHVTILEEARAGGENTK